MMDDEKNMKKREREDMEEDMEEEEIVDDSDGEENYFHDDDEELFEPPHKRVKFMGEENLQHQDDDDDDDDDDMTIGVEVEVEVEVEVDTGEHKTDSTDFGEEFDIDFDDNGFSDEDFGDPTSIPDVQPLPDWMKIVPRKGIVWNKSYLVTPNGIRILLHDTVSKCVLLFKDLDHKPNSKTPATKDFGNIVLKILLGKSLHHHVESVISAVSPDDPEEVLKRCLNVEAFVSKVLSKRKKKKKKKTSKWERLGLNPFCLPGMDSQKCRMSWKLFFGEPTRMMGILHSFLESIGGFLGKRDGKTFTGFVNLVQVLRDQCSLLAELANVLHVPSSRLFQQYQSLAKELSLWNDQEGIKWAYVLMMKAGSTGYTTLLEKLEDANEGSLKIKVLLQQYHSLPETTEIEGYRKIVRNVFAELEKKIEWKSFSRKEFENQKMSVAFYVTLIYGLSKGATKLCKVGFGERVLSKMKN